MSDPKVKQPENRLFSGQVQIYSAFRLNSCSFRKCHKGLQILQEEKTCKISDPTRQIKSGRTPRPASVNTSGDTPPRDRTLKRA